MFGKKQELPQQNPSFTTNPKGHIPDVPGSPVWEEGEGKKPQQEVDLPPQPKKQIEEGDTLYQLLAEFSYRLDKIEAALFRMKGAI